MAAFLVLYTEKNNIITANPTRNVILFSRFFLKGFEVITKKLHSIKKFVVKNLKSPGWLAALIYLKGLERNLVLLKNCSPEDENL